MKKILFILFLCFSFAGYGQNKFPSTDSLTNYINRYVQNSAVNSFTNNRMNNILIGLTQMVDSLRDGGYVDSIWIGTNDTLKYRIGSSTFVIGRISGGTTYTNGLTESGGVVKLGGTLTENTIISGNGYNYYISGANIGLFDATSLQIRSTGRSVITLNDALRLFPHLGQIVIDSLVASSNLTNKQFTVLDTTTGALYRYAGSLLTPSDTASMLDPYLLANVAAATYQPIGSYLTAEVDNLDSVVRRGAFTTIDSFGIPGRVIFRNQGGLVGNIAVRSSLNDQNITISSNTIAFRTSGNLIGLGFETPTSSHFPRIPTSNGTLITNVILNGVTYNGDSNGTADLGTITGSADSSIFAPQFRLDSTRNGIRQDLNAKLNISVAAATYQPIDSSLLAANHNARKKYTEITEFLPATFSNGTYINNTNFQQVFGGGAIFYSQQDTANGCITISSNVSGASTPYISHGAFSLKLSDTWVSEFRIKIPTLNDGTQRYFLRIGYVGEANVANPVSGMYFTYDLNGTQTGSSASPNWQLVTGQSSLRSWITSSAPVIAGKWEKLTIKATTSSVHYYLNDQLLGSISTNLPTDYVSPYIDFRKTNGATARTILVDYYTHDIYYNTAR